jgi:hypothetical protein
VAPSATSSPLNCCKPGTPPQQSAHRRRRGAYNYPKDTSLENRAPIAELSRLTSMLGLCYKSHYCLPGCRRLRPVRRCWRCSVRDSKAKSATRQLVPEASVNYFDLEALEQHCAAGRAPCVPCRAAGGVVIDGVQRRPATAVQVGRA